MSRDLSNFDRRGYDKGRSRLIQGAWFATLHLVFTKWWLPPRLRPPLLRLFGAHVGQGVLIRHRVLVQWPWKLRIGDDSWIGEGAWLINLEAITIGSNVCISQGAILCTGSHKADDPRFAYDNEQICVEDGAWVAIGATILRGAVVPRDEVVPAGCVRRRRRST